MIIDIIMKSEDGNYWERLHFTSEGFKELIKEDPDKLLAIMKKVEDSIPKGIKGSFNEPSEMSLTMMTACGAGAR